MREERNRFSRSFAGVRREKNEEAPVDAGAFSEKSTSNVQQHDTPASTDLGDPFIWLFDPLRPGAAYETIANFGLRDGRLSARSDAKSLDLQDIASKSQEIELSGNATEDFCAAGAVAIRKWMPQSRRTAQDVMTRIRQDIAYQQGKMADIEESQPRPGSRRPSDSRLDLDQTAASEAKRLHGRDFSVRSLNTIVFRWTRVLSVATVLALVIVFVVYQLGIGGTRYYVHFTVNAPNARTVSVIGDFNDWDATAHPLRQAQGQGLWETWVPVRPGRYRYAFLVDGRRHIVDRARLLRFDDDLQRGVSILIVPRGGGPPVITGDGESAGAFDLRSANIR